MKRKFLLTTALALCLCSCAGSIGPSVSHSGTGQEVIEGTLAENEVFYVYLGDNLIRSFALENQPSQIHADYKCHELKYVYTWDSLTLDFAINNSSYTEYYYGNNISMVLLKIDNK